MNRIPTHESTRESINRAEEVWQSALADWSKCDFNSLQSQNVQTEFKEPILLLPDMENLRIDHQGALQPTSFSHRGGTFIVVATRSMIRRLVLEGVLDRFASDFSYADSQNHAVQEAMDNFLTDYAMPWKPGWTGIYLPMGIPLLVSIALLVTDGIFMALVPTDVILNDSLPNFTLGAMSLILFNLWIYAMSRLMREVIRACDRVEQYITVLSNQHLSRFEQLQSYNEAAKADKGVSETRMTILFLWMVGFFPGAILATIQLRGLDSLWMISNYVTSLVVLTLMLWPVAGKASVFQVFFTACYFMIRTKFRKLRFKKSIQNDSSRNVDS